MPTYEYKCEDGHVTEHRCMPSDMPQELICNHLTDREVKTIGCFHLMQGGEGRTKGCPRCDMSDASCGKTARRAFITPPTLWLVGTTHQTVLDTPDAKRHKAGYTHTHGDRPATRTTSGPGGMSRTEFKHDHPDAQWFKPDGTKGTAPGEST